MQGVGCVVGGAHWFSFFPAGPEAVRAPLVPASVTADRSRLGFPPEKTDHVSFQHGKEPRSDSRVPGKHGEWRTGHQRVPGRRQAWDADLDGSGRLCARICSGEESSWELVGKPS